MQVLGCYCAGIYYCIYRIVLLSRPTSCALVQTAYFQAALCAGYAVGAHDARCPPLLYDCRDRVMGDLAVFQGTAARLGFCIIKRDGSRFFCTQEKFFCTQEKFLLGNRLAVLWVTVSHCTRYRRHIQVIRAFVWIAPSYQKTVCLADQTDCKNFDDPRCG